MGKGREESYDDHSVVNDFSELAAEQRMANLIEVAKTIEVYTGGELLRGEGRAVLIARYRAFESVLEEIQRENRITGMRRALVQSRPDLAEADIVAWIEERLGASI